MSVIEAVVRQLHAERYPDAPLLLLAGSLVRGDGTVHSDLDLVVVHEHVDHAYRESFRYQGWPVEAFVHDAETMEHFFVEVDRPSGVMSLANMVVEGIELPAPSPLSRAVKARARAVLAAGPAPLDTAALRHKRYAITDLVDDLRAPRSPGEQVATAIRLYGALADLHLRARGRWSAHGKHVPRALAADDPAYAARFVAAFDALFAGHESGPVVRLAEETLAPLGGFLFEGHRLDAPASWRKG
jgi:hypothetical protein